MSRIEYDMHKARGLQNYYFMHVKSVAIVMFLEWIFGTTVMYGSSLLIDGYYLAPFKTVKKEEGARAEVMYFFQWQGVITLIDVHGQTCR